MGTKGRHNIKKPKQDKKLKEQTVQDEAIKTPEKTTYFNTRK